MDKSRVLYDLGPVHGSNIIQDILIPIHIRTSVTVDHKVDGGLLKQAWERTKRVYPIIDSILGYDQDDPSVYMDPVSAAKYAKDHIYLIRAEEGTNEPIETKVPVSPATEAVGNRLLAVSYYDNTITIGMYHRLVDGGGLNMVFNTLLYAYLALYTGHEDDDPVVELTEGRAIEEYYISDTPQFIFSKAYTPTPLYTLPVGCRGFCDEDMVNDENEVLLGNIAFSASEFIKLCKDNGANPSAMICTLAAKAAYNLNPEEKNDIVFGVSVSEKKILGIEKSIANAVGIGIAYTTRENVENKPLADIAGKIRADIDYQRTKDHYLSHYHVFQSYKQVLNFKYRTITYIGSINVGDNNHKIIDSCLSTYGDNNLFLMQLNDKFYISLQYGKATEKYLTEFERIFTGLGIECEIIHHAATVPFDVKEAVL
ncbi:MAG: hypothetical protein K5877_09340 [Lachnospiraceae bacterium]|nr:hypothetical protein [Lachnospiraceae bacterium]